MLEYSAYVYHKPNFGHVYHPCKEEIPSDMPVPKGNLTTTFALDKVGHNNQPFVRLGTKNKREAISVNSCS